MAPPYAGYIRVSFVGRRKGDRFHSPQEQADAIRDWARQNETEVEILEPELDRSGGDTSRPILETALRGIDEGRYSGLVVAYLSRVARSTRHTLEIYERVEAAGGRVVAVAENLDVSTVDGRMTRTIHSAIAQAELERHRERFAALRQRTVERGLWSQRQVPLGYDKDPQTRKLVPSTDATLVRDLFLRRAAGDSTTGLAARANMSRSGIRKLLANRVYLGEIRDGEHVNPSAHEPIVSAAEWDAAQSAPRPSRQPPKRSPALLAGMVWCGSCGRRMTRGGNAKVKGGFIYRCSDTGRCPGPASIVAFRLDEWVESLAVKALRQTAARPSVDERVEQTQVALKRAEAELEAFTLAVSAADVGVETFRLGIETRRKAVLEARLELERIAPRSSLPDEVLSLWPQMSQAKRGEVLRGLFEAVVVWPSGGTLFRGAPVSDRAQVYWPGSEIVPDIRSVTARGGAPIVPIERHDDGDPRVASFALPDSSERRRGAL